MTLTSSEIAARASACAPQLELTGPWQRLGGLVNVVHRVGTASGGSVIVKHAPPHLASAPDVPLSPLRLAFEHEALRVLAPTGTLAQALGPAVQIPAPLGMDRRDSVLVLEDFGDLPDLAAALVDDPGRADELRTLGSALARLHALGAGRSDLATDFDNHDVQAVRLRTQYAAVEGWLATAGIPDAVELGARAAALGHALLGPGRCLVMGDLWPASLLAATGGGLRLIDWEFAHFGRPLQDVAHLGAHLWMQAHRAPHPEIARAFRRALHAFCDGYAVELSQAPGLFDAAELRDAAVHAGCEILARTLGPFRTGFLYDGLRPDDPALRAAVRTAAEQIRSPADGGLLAPLVARSGRRVGTA